MSMMADGECWVCQELLSPGNTKYFRACLEDGTWKHVIAPVSCGVEVNRYSWEELKRIVVSRVREHDSRLKAWRDGDETGPVPERDRSVPSPVIFVALCGREECGKGLSRCFERLQKNINVGYPRFAGLYEWYDESPFNDPEDPDLYDPPRKRRGRRREEKKRRRGEEGGRDTSLRRSEPTE